MKVAMALLTALSIVACSGQSRTEATVSSLANKSAENLERKAHGAGKANAAESEDSEEFTSDYTDLTNTECTTIESDETGAGYIREQCGQFKGIPLFRVEGDLRQHAYAGNIPSGQITIAPFNYLGEKVEWRMQAGKPIALIYRLIADAPDIPESGKTQLFVQKIGVGDEQGCIIGLVAGSYKDANDVARMIADTAENRDCALDDMTSKFGDVM